jgi:putative membrane protein
MTSRSLRIACLGVVLAALVWSGVRPHAWGTWFFETVWVFGGLVLVTAYWRRFPLTALLCVLLTVWAVVLAYGGHTSYALTPLGSALQDVLGLDRNPYDRIAHFVQGFVPAIAFREVLWRTSPLRGSRWLAPVAAAFCLALSAFWELMEWCGAYLVAHGSPEFLGGQGDPWDTQWDMLLALLGAVLSLLLLSRIHERQLTVVSAAQAPA